MGRKKKPLNELRDGELTRRLDKAFSLFIRQRDTDGNGEGVCSTCGKFGHYSTMDAGHFISRRFTNLRWDERNVHLQCKYCNGYGNGEQFKMARYIDTKYGKGTADLLHELRHKKEPPTKIDKIKMIIKYERK